VGEVGEYDDDESVKNQTLYNEFLKNPLKKFEGNTSDFLKFKESGPFNLSNIPERNNIDLIGYFQNYNYFDFYKKEIIKSIEPNNSITDFINSSYLDVPLRKTSIHIRRGDYLNLSDYHPVISLEYYRNAIDIINEETDIFIIFSDDIGWCKENLGFIKNSFFFPTSNEFIEMFAIGECNNHIIANSSFSWWGSYISKNIGKVIAPKVWLGPSYRGTDYSGIYRKNMIVI
jgi:hypothetical protein